MVEELGISKEEASNFCLQVYKEFFIQSHLLLLRVRFWAAKNTLWRIIRSAPSPACWRISSLSAKPFSSSATRTTSPSRFDCCSVFTTTCSQVASDIVYPLLEKTAKRHNTANAVKRSQSTTAVMKSRKNTLEPTSSLSMEGLLTFHVDMISLPCQRC